MKKRGPLKKSFKIYLIGFDPPELEPLSRELAERLMREADCTALVDRPVPIGEEFGVATIMSGHNGVAPPERAKLRVTKLHYFGKLITAEVIE